MISSYANQVSHWCVFLSPIMSESHEGRVHVTHGHDDYKFHRIAHILLLLAETLPTPNAPIRV